MSFQDAVRTCLTQKYADFSGRARRSEYWFFFLFTVLVIIVASIIDPLLHTPRSLYNTGLIQSLALLALLLPGLAVGARRLHDTGRPGWWIALPYVSFALMAGVAFPAAALTFLDGSGQPSPNIPLVLFYVSALVTLVAVIVLLVFLVQDSHPDNQYGPNPKGVGAGDGGYGEVPPPAPSHSTGPTPTP